MSENENYLSTITTEDEIPITVGMLYAPNGVSIPLEQTKDKTLMVAVSAIGIAIGYPNGFNLSSWTGIIKKRNIILRKTRRNNGGTAPRNTKYYFLLQDVKNFLTGYCAETSRAAPRTQKQFRHDTAMRLLNEWDSMVDKLNCNINDCNVVSNFQTGKNSPQTYLDAVQLSPQFTATTKTSLIEEFASAYKIPVDEVKRFVIAAKCKFDPTLADLFGQLL